MAIPLLLLDAVCRNWWMLALRGLAAIIFGVCAYMWPGLTLVVLAVMWGAFTVADGLTAISVGIAGKWWSMVAAGVLSLLVGAAALVYPGLTAFALLYLIAAWAIVRGLVEVVAAIHLRHVIEGEGWLILGGLATVAFGALILAFPGAGALSVVWIIATYAIVFGVLAILVAFRLRAFRRSDAMVALDRVGMAR